MKTRNDKSMVKLECLNFLKFVSILPYLDIY